MNVINLIDDKLPYDVYCMGDIHGYFDEMLHDIVDEKKLQNCLIFCCGDIGVGFYKTSYYEDILYNINNKLKKHNITLIFIRGNHDNPRFFDDTSNVSKILSKLSNIIFVDDYSIVETNIGNVLCVGGGISIDRKNRVLGYSYWVDENVKKMNDEIKKFIIENNIEFVCSHSAPKIAMPTQKYIGNWLSFDIHLASDLGEERQNLQDIYDYLCEIGKKPRIWCYGHFHSHYNVEIEDTIFHCCDMYRDKSCIGIGVDLFRLMK